MAGLGVRAVALVLGLYSGWAAAKGEAPSAIVVGGGMAGLAAAYELQQSGWQVTLLEAKAQVGGRSALAGGEWIGNAKAQPVLNAYLETFKLATRPAPEQVRSPGYLIDGHYLDAAALAAKQPATATALERFEKTLDELAARIEDPLNPAATRELFALDQTNTARWLDTLALPETARLLINQQIRSRYDEPSRLSLLHLVQQTRVQRGIDERDRRAARLPGGSAVLAQAFAKRLKTLKTQARVASISQDDKGVAVRAGKHDYRADYLVLAVPLRALADIQLTPALSEKQRSALQGTTYGWRDQILLKFRKAPWDAKNGLVGEIYSDQGLGMLWVEPAQKGAAQVLVNLSGDNARLLQSFGDRQVVDQLLIRLHEHFPRTRGAFSGYEMRRYSRDPGTQGAYLAYGPGQISRFWRLWEAPLQRLAFAGEHTDALYPGTLEGALRSGQRAAAQLRDLHAGKPVQALAASGR